MQAKAEEHIRRLNEIEQQQQQAVQLAQQQIEQQLQQQAAAALAASQLLDPSYASYFDPNFALAAQEQTGELLYPTYITPYKISRFPMEFILLLLVTILFFV